MSILAHSITSNNTATTMAIEVLKYRPQMQYLRTLICCLLLLRFHLSNELAYSWHNFENFTANLIRTASIIYSMLLPCRS